MVEWGVRSTEEWIGVAAEGLENIGRQSGQKGSEPEGGQRLPDADDVLAKWMALRADERGLINEANMHLPGRQLDPDHVRRDLARLSEWTSRSSQLSMEQ